MFLISFEISLILTLSEICVISNAATATTFAVTYNKFYVPAVNLSIQNNLELMQQLNSVFKGTIDWKNYHSKVST